MPVILTNPYNVPIYRQEVLADSPVLYMRLGETSGPAIDLMGTHSGTYIGSPTRGTASLIQNNEGDLSCSFSGTGQRIDVTGGFPAGGATAAQTPYSIECWYSGWNDTDFVILFVQFETVSGNGKYNVQLALRESPLGAFVEKDDPLGGGLYSNAGYGSGIHHVVYTESRADPHRAMYVDGALIYQDSYPETYTSPDTMTNVYIGNRNPFAMNSSITIDELAVYNYELTLPRIQAHYNVGA